MGFVMRIGIATAAMLLALLPVDGAWAQTTEVTPDETTAPAAPPVVESLPPAYDGQMLRLAEVLGSLHYLRELCGAKEGQVWREEMQKLIEREVPTEVRK